MKCLVSNDHSFLSYFIGHSWSSFIFKMQFIYYLDVMWLICSGWWWRWWSYHVLVCLTSSARRFPGTLFSYGVNIIKSSGARVTVLFPHLQRLQRSLTRQRWWRLCPLPPALIWWRILGNVPWWWELWKQMKIKCLDRFFVASHKHRLKICWLKGVSFPCQSHWIKWVNNQVTSQCHIYSRVYFLKLLTWKRKLSLMFTLMLNPETSTAVQLMMCDLITRICLVFIVF